MKCPFCSSDSDYSNLGNHWRQACGYPEPENKEVFDGLLMGDGNLKQSHIPENRYGNQAIEVVSISEPFINHLYEDYKPFFTEPSIRRTAKESAEGSKDSDIISVSEGSTFRTQYRIVSRTIPYFNKYDSWRTSGKKRWPEDIEFTPDRLKYLYCADGGLSWNKKSKSVRAQISSTNEPEQLERICNMLNDMGIDCRVYNDRVMLKPSSTDEFLDYLGEPVTGFEYKWENGDLDTYEDLYENIYEREEHTYTV